MDTTSSTGRPSRVLSRWSQFGALVFAPWAGRPSLRDGVTARAAPADALAPLGVTPPKRSPLAEAHARRPAALDHRLLAALYARGQAVAPRHGFRCNNPRCSVDRPTSALGVNRWPWVRFRTAQGAITVHTRLEHAGHLPALVVITAGQQRDLAMAHGRERPKGRMVAMDRGDSDSPCLCRLPQGSVSCVTRQQVNATCTVPAGLAVDRPRGVTADQNGVLPGQPGSAYPEARRRGGGRDSATGTHEVCWTTACQLAAATLAASYQARWQVELCVTTSQQHRQIKTCVGTSEHAVMPPMGGARITSLRRAFLRLKSGLGRSFPPLLRRLPITLFDRRNRVD